MLKLIFFVIFSLNVHLVVPSISDKRLCANQNCSELISVAKTLIRYSSPDGRILSFAPNVEVKVFSKSAGSNMDLWGVEINGKRGYVNKNLIRETKILKKEFAYLVDTEPIMKVHDNKKVSLDKAESEEIVPNKVQKEYEIIDGTIINLNVDEFNDQSIIEADPVINLVEPSVMPQMNNPVEDLVMQNSEELDLTAENKGTESLLNNNSDEKSKIESKSEIKNFVSEHLIERDDVIRNINDIHANEEVNILDEKNSLNTEHEIIKNSLSNFLEKVENIASEDINDENDRDDDDDDDEEEEEEEEEEPHDDYENEDEESKLNSSENDSKSSDTIKKLFNTNSNNTIDSYSITSDNIINATNTDGAVIKEEFHNDLVKSRNLLSTVNTDVSAELIEEESLAQETLKLNNLNISVQILDKFKEINPEDEVKNLNSEGETVHSSKILSGGMAVSESNKIHEGSKLNDETFLQEQVVREATSTETSMYELTNLYEVDTDVTSNPLESNSAVYMNNADSENNIKDNVIPPKILSDKITSEQEIITNNINDVLVKENMHMEINEHTETVIYDKKDVETIDSQLSGIHNDLLDETGIVDKQNNNNKDENREDYLEVQEPNETFLTGKKGEALTDEDKDDRLQGNKDRHTLLSKDFKDYGSCSADDTKCIYDTSPEDVNIESEPYIEKLFHIIKVRNEYDSDFLNLLSILGITGVSVVLFLLGYVIIDRSRKEGPLIAKINNLEKSLLIATKENQLLTDRISEVQSELVQGHESVTNEMYEKLELRLQETLNIRKALEEQIQSLERELENSTEVGLELNRMLSDILSSQNGSDILIANVEQLQRQLVEQQSTINSVNTALNLKNTENHELQLELEINNKKVIDLQAELDKMVLNIFKIEEEKEQLQNRLNNDETLLKSEMEKTRNNFNSERKKLVEDINLFKSNCAELQRSLEQKNIEYVLFKETIGQIEAVENDSEIIKSVLDMSSIKAQVQQLQRDNQTLTNLLHQEKQTRHVFEKQVEHALQETQCLRTQYDEADKEKLEAQTKLEVLSSYFRDREAQLQKELHKQESMWVDKQGEATSTIERIKYMQEELQNCKAQNESLKQEIVSQEVELKSQISVLEKKSHESWVAARQAERKLEDARQEAMQLRNRLTLKERSFLEGKGQKRIQSPLEQNGQLPTSPLHLPVELPASPPLLYGTREHLTTSPPVSGLPPFLPPPGIRFMPAFMPPPPPSIFPVDHRPPPLGRMSSPPHNSRYSPYDRNSPSPLYDDDYGSSSPPPPLPLHRDYSPYNSRDDRKDYKRPPSVRNSGRSKGAVSSDSGTSNESLEKVNRHR